MADVRPIIVDMNEKWIYLRKTGGESVKVIGFTGSINGLDVGFCAIEEDGESKMTVFDLYSSAFLSADVVLDDNYDLDNKEDIRHAVITSAVLLRGRLSDAAVQRIADANESVDKVKQPEELADNEMVVWEK